jgi:CDP-diglyceride synthetase
MRPSFSLRWLFAVTAFIGLGFAALVNANVWWSLGTNAVVFCLLFYAGVRACVPNSPHRPFWLAFAVSAVFSSIVAGHLTGALIPYGIIRYVAARAAGFDVKIGDESRWWIDQPGQPDFRLYTEIGVALWAMAFGALGGALASLLAYKYKPKDEGRAP